MRGWLAATALFCAAGVLPAQTPLEPARIEGNVMNAVTGQPVRKAQIALQPAGEGEPILGFTDSHGIFVLGKVAAGAYHLKVTHDSYIAQMYGAKKPGAKE